jgi:hypothetical protein
VAPRLQAGLQRFATHPLVGQARGLGLIGALELAEDPAARKPFDPKRGVGAYFVKRAQAHGLILRVLGGDVIAFSPPLVITEAEIDFMLEKTALALDETLAWVRGCLSAAAMALIEFDRHQQALPRWQRAGGGRPDAGHRGRRVHHPAGPSGSGKTTTLMLLAGFEAAQRGRDPARRPAHPEPAAAPAAAWAWCSRAIRCSRT